MRLSGEPYEPVEFDGSEVSVFSDVPEALDVSGAPCVSRSFDVLRALDVAGGLGGSTGGCRFPRLTSIHTVVFISTNSLFLEAETTVPLGL